MKNTTTAKAEKAPITDALLIEFAKRTLAILERDEDWDADTIDDIGLRAIELGLADNGGEYGLFRNLAP